MMKFKSKVYFLCSVTIGLVLSERAAAQNSDENYVKVYKAVVPVAGDLSLINDKQKVVESVTYIDGLGRHLQSVERQATPLGYDLVSFSLYDEYGRKTKTSLPYPTTEVTGSSKSGLTVNQTSFYQSTAGNNDGANAFSIQKFESSELNRVMKQGAPGMAWQPLGVDPYENNDKTIKRRYLSNGIKEVLRLKWDATTNTIVQNGPTLFYDPSTVLKNNTFDESNNVVIEFKDNEGRILCKKVQSSELNEPLAFAETYYIYDDLGNLMVVLPPEAVVKLKAQVGN